MKRQLITLAIASGLALGGLTAATAQDNNDGPGGHGHGGHRGQHGWKHGNPMEHLTKKLDLTPDQQTKVQPILDQAKPQMEAIHRDAMQKMKALHDSTMDQIRPLLTPEQQQKLDAMKQEHEKMRAEQSQ